MPPDLLNVASNGESVLLAELSMSAVNLLETINYSTSKVMDLLPVKEFQLPGNSWSSRRRETKASPIPWSGLRCSYPDPPLTREQRNHSDNEITSFCLRRAIISLSSRIFHREIMAEVLAAEIERRNLLFTDICRRMVREGYLQNII